VKLNQEVHYLGVELGLIVALGYLNYFKVNCILYKICQ